MSSHFFFGLPKFYCCANVVVQKYVRKFFAHILNFSLLPQWWYNFHFASVATTTHDKNLWYIKAWLSQYQLKWTVKQDIDLNRLVSWLSKASERPSVTYSLHCNALYTLQTCSALPYFSLSYCALSCFVLLYSSVQCSHFPDYQAVSRYSSVQSRKSWRFLKKITDLSP